MSRLDFTIEVQSELNKFENRLKEIYGARLKELLKDTVPQKPLSKETLLEIEAFLEEIMFVNQECRWAFGLFAVIEKAIDTCGYAFMRTH
jgi:hypothetical protein